MRHEVTFDLVWSDRLFDPILAMDLEFQIRTPFGHRIAKELKRLGFEGIEARPTMLYRSFSMVSSTVKMTAYVRRGVAATLRPPKALHSAESTRNVRRDEFLPVAEHTADAVKLLHGQYLSMLESFPGKAIPEELVSLERMQYYIQLGRLVELARDLRV